ncbi:MAG: (Fe-S)-binding protein [Arenimonas sp.]|uniref:(Fe-S)-binding protein n=1 Tax=Arenimonas sp. TaxID=1872635 RepID=UPI0025BAA1AA|nr:(Fe-S)-binding protein [Arenimonas sp.]MBW8366243.1 (Fe-S)-binding protein [Arenimonas sp.]
MPALPDPALRAAPPAPADAALVALADRCVQCGLCLPHCPTYRLDQTEAESPRGRIAYIKAVAQGGLAPTLAGDLHLDHCLGCRRCEPVCPAGVSYGELLVGARAAQAARHAPAPALRAAGWLLARPPLLGRLVDLQRAVGAWLPAALRPRLPPAPPAVEMPAPPAVAKAEVAVFVGCIADRYESGTRAGLARLLAAAGIVVALPEGQGCCGAAAAHAGDPATGGRLAAAHPPALAGRARGLCLGPRWQGSLARRRAGAAPVEDALAALDRLGDQLRWRPAHRRVALHLPCTQRSVVRSESALRRLLQRIPGLDLVELPDTGCCGAAGLHQLAEPARADALRAPVLQALAESGATELLSANIGCRLHLATGTIMPVRHPIDFLAEHLA